jgi:hypothetical protein
MLTRSLRCFFPALLAPFFAVAMPVFSDQREGTILSIEATMALAGWGDGIM